MSFPRGSEEVASKYVSTKGCLGEAIWTLVRELCCDSDKDLEVEEQPQERSYGSKNRRRTAVRGAHC